MAPKELTRFQLSSKLAYTQSTPSFLQKFKNRMAGAPDEVDSGEYFDFEDDGSGRPPIPRRPRPALPERHSDDPLSVDEDNEDEKPQIVVLKKGKHLTELEAENFRRQEKGLPPLLNQEDTEKCDNLISVQEGKGKIKKNETDFKASLSFSSSKNPPKPKTSNTKRKTVSVTLGGGEEAVEQPGGLTKKQKKSSKTLLSFEDNE